MTSPFKFQIGDVVEVINRYYVYDYYTEMANHFNIINWQHAINPLNEKYKKEPNSFVVRDFGYHLSRSKTDNKKIYYIERNGLGWMMEEGGIKLLKKRDFLTVEDFEI